MALICVASAAVERREARAPEAQANGNIRLCGALPHPLMRLQDNCAFRRSASLHLGGPFVGIAWQSSGAHRTARTHVAIRAP